MSHSTGLSVQYRALLRALTDRHRDGPGRYVLTEAIVDQSVLHRLEQLDPELRREIEGHEGVHAVEPWRPGPMRRFERRDNWRDVLVQALRHSDRYGDEGVAIGELMRACRDNGWTLDFKRARRLVRKRRKLPDNVPALIPRTALMAPAG